MAKDPISLNGDFALLVVDYSHDSEWVTLYKEGLSTTTIARRYGVCSNTVRRHLIKTMVLRNRIEAGIQASTKYKKYPFSGNQGAAAYLCGFIEDCHIRKSGRLVEVSTTTTHPAMEQLFRDLFESYGHVTRTAGFDNVHSYYRYHLTTYLEASFEQVLEKGTDLPAKVPRESSNPMFYSYLAGLVDAEGGVRLYNNHTRADSVLYITINKLDLLSSLREVVGGKLYFHERAWRLVFYGKRAIRILRQLPLRHAEKISKSQLVRAATGKPWREVAADWQEIVRDIHSGVSDYKTCAMHEYIDVHDGRHPKDASVGE